MYKETHAKLDNTVFEVRLDKEGKVLSYRIHPANGYRLHENTLDSPIIDEETHQNTGGIKLGFTNSYVTTGADYDFEKNERQIYAEREDQNEYNC
jgi:hypothetical protein